jgi:hypothetical protein
VPQDHAKAVRWYRKAAEQGHASAQYNLGVSYQEGEGVPQDYVEAHVWLNIAVSHASSDKREKWVKSRDEVAQKMSRPQIAEAQHRARESSNASLPDAIGDAERGDPAAQANVGIMYFEGKGVPQDFVEAHMWLNLATSRVTSDLKQTHARQREDVTREMTAPQIAEAQRRAREWTPKTAQEAKQLNGK